MRLDPLRYLVEAVLPSEGHTHFGKFALPHGLDLVNLLFRALLVRENSLYPVSRLLPTIVLGLLLEGILLRIVLGGRLLLDRLGADDRWLLPEMCRTCIASLRLAVLLNLSLCQILRLAGLATGHARLVTLYVPHSWSRTAGGMEGPRRHRGLLGLW